MEDVCIKITDGSHWSPKSQEFGLPMASVKDMTETDIDLSSCRKISKTDFDALVKNDCKPKIGDVLIAKDGSYLKQVFDIKEEKDVVVLSSIAIIRPDKNKITSSFLKYIFKNPIFQEDVKNHYVSGAVIPRIVLKDFRKISFSLPPLDVQRKIAGILGALDDKIEVLREQNKTLEQMAQAVFQSWFVDFDIVRAKAAGLPAADVCKKYHITPDIYDLFPSAFSADNLSLGWEKIPFSETMDIISGGTPKTTEPAFWNGEIPWYSVVDAPASVYVLDMEKHITKLGLEKSPCSLLEKDTVIISARGTVGKLAVVGKPMAMNQSCYGLKFDFPYYGYLMTKQMLIWLKQNVHGAVFDTITKDTFKTVQTVNVSKILQEAFTNIVSSFFKKIYENRKQIRTLEQTRDTLLPQLLNGKIDVENVSLSVLDNRV